MTDNKALASEEYDLHWNKLDDFIKYNPGARHRRRLIVNLIKDLNVTTALDVGCGPGELMLLLKRTFPEIKNITGADFAEDTIRKNREKYPGFQFSILDVEKSHLDSCYDLVICSEVIEHMNMQEQAFANLAAMVKPGGYLLITCPTGKIFETQRYFGHVRHPSKNELLSYASKNKMEPVVINNWGWPSYKFMQEVINLKPQSIINSFAGGRYNSIKKLINDSIYYFQFLNIPNSSSGVQFFALFKTQKS